MKNPIIIILAAATLSALSSCEKILEYEIEEGVNKLSLSSIVTTDTTVSVAVAAVYDFYDLPPAGDNIYESAKYIPFYNGNEDYENNAVERNADVRISINGTAAKAEFDGNSLSYRIDRKPKAGDHVTVEATVEGKGSVFAETTIPQPVEITVVDHEVYYDKRMIYTPTVDQVTDLISGDDYMMRLRLRISDPAGTHNFYRLKVRSVSYTPDFYGESGYFLCDIFYTTDIIFHDERVAEKYGAWEKEFSNLFDDMLFDGREYEFTVESRKRKGENPYVIVELQSLNSELYYYLKSVQYYRTSSYDVYAEPVQIVGNVSNGYGVVGGMSVSRHIIPFPEQLPEKQ